MLAPQTIEILSRAVAPANSASFVWKQLSNSPTIQHLSRTATPVQLLAEIERICALPEIDESSATAAYAFAVALLLHNASLNEKIRSVVGSDRLFWLRRLEAPAHRMASDTRLSQPTIVLRGSEQVTQSAASASASLIVIPE